jgi:DNA-binding IclR family transcriptional regulator
MVAERLLTRLTDGRYRVGWRLVRVVRESLLSQDVVSLFLEACRAFNPMPDETVVLSLLDGDHVLYVAHRQGARPLSVHYRLGLRLRARFTASGKCLLAWLSLAELKVLNDTELADPAFLAELDLIRRHGYSIDDEETAAGMICYGAPVFDGQHSAAVAAVAVSMVKAGAGADRSKEIVGLARRVSSLLGHVPEYMESA